MRKLAVLAVVFSYVGMVSVRAATVTWTGLGANDNWNTNANWSGTGNPPNFMDDAVVGAPAPTVLNVNGLVMTLQVDDGGLINMLGGNDLTITQSVLTNFGEIVVNSDAVDLLSSINFNIATTIDGKGTILLNKPFFPGLPGFFPDRGATIESPSQINHGANHTIEGAGRINATLLNEGTVRALNPGGGTTLVLGTNQQFNENLFTSSPTGTLAILSSRITQGAAGRIVADTSGVTLDGTKIIGGTLQSVAGGLISVVGTNGARFQDVLNEAVVNAGAFLGIEGSGFTNNGTVNGGTIRFDDSMTLDGTGEFVLNNGNLQTLPPAVVTQGANHTIRGKGTISAPLINNGLIEVSPVGVGGTTMTFTASSKTNNGIIRATAGTNLNIDNPVMITQDPNAGHVIAADSVVQFNSGTGVNGGRVEATGTGRTEVRGLVSFTDVTVEGTLNVRAQPTVQLSVLGSSLTNNGLVTVNPSFANVAHTINFNGQTNMSLAGTGEIVLNGPGSRAQLTVAAGKTLTHEFGHTISGFGFINGNFVNQGNIEGDSEFNPIEFNGTLSGTNHLENVRINGVHSIGLGSIYGVPTFGTYELTDTSTVEFEIGGTHLNFFDNLTGQTVKLDGTLSLTQIDTGSGVFQPQLGDTFEIINATNVMGTFDDVTTTGLDPNLKYNVIYDTVSSVNTVTLEAVRRYSADFDFDGDVDDDDLDIWEMGYGMSSGASYTDGDSDDDGDVDGTDFLAWQQQYGSISVPSPATAVPEPGAAILAMTGLAMALRRRRSEIHSPQ